MRMSATGRKTAFVLRSRVKSPFAAAGREEPSRLSGPLRGWDDEGVKLAILCGGGPAPGMNSVIAAATIEARNSGWDVLGIVDGFQHLIDGRVEEARPLSLTDVSRIHVQGGSVIRKIGRAPCRVRA